MDQVYSINTWSTCDPGGSATLGHLSRLLVWSARCDKWSHQMSCCSPEALLLLVFCSGVLSWSLQAVYWCGSTFCRQPHNLFEAVVNRRAHPPVKYWLRRGCGLNLLLCGRADYRASFQSELHGTSSLRFGRFLPQSMVRALLDIKGFRAIGCEQIQDLRLLTI